jgi:hypothetical protein
VTASSILDGPWERDMELISGDVMDALDGGIGTVENLPMLNLRDKSSMVA